LEALAVLRAVAPALFRYLMVRHAELLRVETGHANCRQGGAHHRFFVKRHFFNQSKNTRSFIGPK
jgi:hypothetical protein